MNKFLSVLDAPLRYFCIGLIYLYKVTISKITPPSCVYKPTCSTYMIVAMKRFGTFKGGILGLKRIIRCTPKHAGEVDPVPDPIDGAMKYKI